MNSIGNAVVLGGTSPHVALVKKLKLRGYTVYLIDFYENPPAKEFCDHHAQISTLDKEKVLDFCQEIDAKVVISTSVDHANLVACYVSEKLGLTHPYSASVASNLTDKTLMKEMMRKVGIPTSKHLTLSEEENVEQVVSVSSLRMPLVVKPADSTGSAGVRKVTNFDELFQAVALAKSLSRNGNVIIEEFVIGDEVSADFFINNGKACLLTVRKKFRFSEASSEWVIQSPGSYAPAKISATALEKLESTANKIARHFKLSRTPLLLQALIENDDVNVIEFTPRIGGGLSYRTVELVTGFDLLEGAVCSFLDENYPVEIQQSGKAFLTFILYGKPSYFSHVDSVEELIKGGFIDEFYAYKTPGMPISGDMSTRARIGAFIVSGFDKEEVARKLSYIKENLNAFGMNGEVIIRNGFFDDVIANFEDGFVQYDFASSK